jgi:4-hydroxybenzoate polyprenyltransferase
VPLLKNLVATLEMIKWEHSIFALPFALCGAMLAAGGMPSVHQLVWIVVAMVAARSAAMSFNRLADASIDAANPRTSARALPAGILSHGFVRSFVLFSAAVFLLAAWELNQLAFLLSPIALAVLLLYSYTKRFTRWSHVVLGFALGIAPAECRAAFNPTISGYCQIAVGCAAVSRLDAGSAHDAGLGFQPWKPGDHWHRCRVSLDRI